MSQMAPIALWLLCSTHWGHFTVPVHDSLKKIRIKKATGAYNCFASDQKQHSWKRRICQALRTCSWMLPCGCALCSVQVKTGCFNKIKLLSAYNQKNFLFTLWGKIYFIFKRFVLILCQILFVDQTIFTLPHVVFLFCRTIWRLFHFKDLNRGII